MQIIDANAAARRLFGMSAASREQASIHLFLATPPDRFEAYLRACSTSTVPRPGLVSLRTAEGAAVEHRCFAARFVLDTVPGPVLFLRLSKRWGTLAKFQELNRHIEAQRRWMRQQELQHQQTLQQLEDAQSAARSDELTGLLNRNAFLADFTGLKRRHARGDVDFLAFMLIDLDGMKQINDTLGHAKGDQVLMAFAASLRTQLRAADQLYRIGGDEFVLMVERPELLSLLEERMDQVLASVERECEVAARCSIGYALLNEVDDPEQLYELADSRMYSQKQHRKRALAAGE